MTGFQLENAYITAENNLAVTDEQAIFWYFAIIITHQLPTL
jgi:hypothetical protein